MQHFFKIGATCAMGAPAGAPFPIHTDDFCQTAQWLSANGFDSMEVHIRTPELVDGGKLADCCAALGLTISSIGTGMAYGAEGLSLTSPDESIRNAAISRLKGQLALGKILNCPVIIGSMRGTIAPGETFEQIDTRMLASMAELADYAEQLSAEFVIEAINRYETNYLCSADELLSFLDRLGSPRVLAHLDSFHMNLEETNMGEAILRCGKRLRHFHAVDNTRCYPGHGMIDFAGILSALQEIGYTGSLTMECLPKPSGADAVLRGLSCLESLMASLKRS